MLIDDSSRGSIRIHKANRKRARRCVTAHAHRPDIVRIDRPGHYHVSLDFEANGTPVIRIRPV